MIDNFNQYGYELDICFQDEHGELTFALDITNSISCCTSFLFIYSLFILNFH